MTYLSNFVYSRDNNLNLLRITAASAVLVAHCFPLALGSGVRDPLEWTGLSLGSLAVDVFFIASGFLVSASLLRTRSVIDFLWARALRIFPGLVVMLVLTVSVLGPLFSSLPLLRYLNSGQTYRYLVYNATLLGDIRYELPGVFLQTPFERVVNGSLWTLPFELNMYLILGAGWVAMGWVGGLRDRLMQAVTISCAAVSLIALVALQWMGHESGEFLRLFFMFFTGAACYFLRHRLWLSGKVATLTVAMAIILVALEPSAFRPVYLGNYIHS